jgi:hypothetical protein
MVVKPVSVGQQVLQVQPVEHRRVDLLAAKVVARQHLMAQREQRAQLEL